MSGHDKRKMLMAVKHKRRKRGQDNCQSKRRYSFHEAQIYGGSYDQKPYSCSTCGMWHLASKTYERLNMDHIRKFYGVSAKRGGRIKYKGKLGTILGSRGAHLRIRLDGEKRVGNYHPEYEIEYL